MTSIPRGCELRRVHGLDGVRAYWIPHSEGCAEGEAGDGGESVPR